jgi:6-phosphofructokinase
MDKNRHIGICTAGGDCPGINAAIAAVVRYASSQNIRMTGFTDGFGGFIHGNYRDLTVEDCIGIERIGGSILGSSREKPFKPEGSDKPVRIKTMYDNQGLDTLICIGGNGTMRTAYRLSEKGLRIIGIPKTIDGDIWGTDRFIGFDTALSTAVDAIDRIIDTARSHKRIIVVEVMGHRTGWLALCTGVASMADIVLIPEIPFSLDIIATNASTCYRSKGYAIVVVAEGITVSGDWKGSSGERIAQMLGVCTGMETRFTSLGYILRGGAPTAADRILAERAGVYAVDLYMRGIFDVMVSFRGDVISEIPLAEIAGKIRNADTDRFVLPHARALGISFGDDYI